MENRMIINDRGEINNGTKHCTRFAESYLKIKHTIMTMDYRHVETVQKMLDLYRDSFTNKEKLKMIFKQRLEIL